MRLKGFETDCVVEVEGDRIPARAGESLAAALIADGKLLAGRSSKYHRPRGPYCLAGHCGACFMRVEGQPNIRACQTPCKDGLSAEQQNAFPTAEHDLLGAIDFLFPKGIEHHTLMVQNALANRASGKVARQLAGLGKIPERTLPPTPPAREEKVDAVVVGAGPAGLGAAEALAAKGLRVVLADQEPELGGRLRCRYALPGEPPWGWVGEVAAAVTKAGGEVARRTAALGIFQDGGSTLVAALQSDGEMPRIRLWRTARVVLCPGGQVQAPIFENNDLPGIFAGRGAAMLLAEGGVLVGERCAILGTGPEAVALASRLEQAGAAVERVDGEVECAKGRSRISSLSLAGRRKKVACDAALVVAPPAPAFELAVQAGAEVFFDEALGAFAVRAAPDGALGKPGMYAAGECLGAVGPGEAAEAGRRAGAAAARTGASQ